MNGKRLATTLMVLAMLLVSAGWTGAQEPQAPGEELSIEGMVNARISYQGVLRENGRPVAGSREMVFRLHTDDTCTTPVGCGILKPSVPVANGLFSVELDVAHTEMNGKGLWLEVEVGGAPIVCQEILPVPYALSLRPGATIRGVHAGSPVLIVENSSTANDSRAIRGYASAASGFTAGVQGRTDSSTTGAKGVWGYAAGGGQTYGVHGESNSTSGRGVYGRANASTGANYGVYAETNSPDGYAVYGTNTAGGYAGRFDGDVSQSRSGDGLVKAGVLAVCGTSSAIVRSFNHAGSTITVTSRATGECTIKFGFQVDDRFWVATAVSTGPRTVTCAPGAIASEIDCDRRDHLGSVEDGEIMVLIY
jgi:hypothetical protein